MLCGYSAQVSGENMIVEKWEQGKMTERKEMPDQADSIEARIARIEARLGIVRSK